MEVHHEFVETHTLEPLGHCVDGCAFLRHEEDALSLGHHGRDQIGDRLALSGARRTLKHKRLPCQRSVDSSVLGRVGIEHQELVLWWHAVGQRRFHRAGAVGLKRFSGRLVACDGRYQVVCGQCLKIALDVIDHRHLLEHEVAQHNMFGNPKIGHTLGAATQLCEDRLLLLFADLLPVSVRIHEALTRNIYIELVGQMLKQCLVELPFAVQSQTEVHLRSSGSLQVDRAEKDRSIRCGAR